MKISSRAIVKILFITLAFCGVLWLAFMTRHQLTWIGVAFFLAVALNPLVEGLRKYIPKQNRPAAVAGVFVAVFLLFGFLLVSFVPMVIEQSQSLTRNLPHYTESLIHGQGLVSDSIRRYNLVDYIRDSQDQLIRYASSAGSQFFAIVQGLFSSFIAALTITVLTLFMLLEGPRRIETFWRLFPKQRREHAQLLANKMYGAVTGYVHGQLLICLIAAVLATIMLAILHIPYAIPLGILVGLLSLLPLFGATIAAIIVIVIALFNSVMAAVVMAIYFLIYQQIENHIIQPVVYGRTVQMSPLLVLISVLIGAGIGGIIGAIVAIPVGASLQILARDIAERRLATNK
jgi:predicted PurR-regulated permease PerM